MYAFGIVQFFFEVLATFRKDFEGFVLSCITKHVLSGKVYDSHYSSSNLVSPCISILSTVTFFFCCSSKVAQALFSSD